MPRYLSRREQLDRQLVKELGIGKRYAEWQLSGLCKPAAKMLKKKIVKHGLLMMKIGDQIIVTSQENEARKAAKSVQPIEKNEENESFSFNIDPQL